MKQSTHSEIVLQVAPVLSTLRTLGTLGTLSALVAMAVFASSAIAQSCSESNRLAKSDAEVQLRANTESVEGGLWQGNPVTKVDNATLDLEDCTATLSFSAYATDKECAPSSNNAAYLDIQLVDASGKPLTPWKHADDVGVSDSDTAEPHERDVTSLFRKFAWKHATSFNMFISGPGNCDKN